MSGRGARRHPGSAVTGTLAGVLLAGALLCGCATSARQCTGSLEPINAPAAAAAPDQRDEP